MTAVFLMNVALSKGGCRKELIVGVVVVVHSVWEKGPTELLQI